MCNFQQYANFYLLPAVIARLDPPIKSEDAIQLEFVSNICNLGICHLFFNVTSLNSSTSSFTILTTASDEIVAPVIA